MLIYIAGPLFSESERDFNRDLKSLLETFGEIYLPQENGKLIWDLEKEGIRLNEAADIIANQDIRAIRDCDLFVAVLDGRTIEEGVAFELGVAHALHKLSICLQTDPRREILGMNNPMIGFACSEVFHDTDELLEFIKNRDH